MFNVKTIPTFFEKVSGIKFNETLLKANYQKPVYIDREIIVDRPFEVIREVFVDRPVEVIREVIREVPMDKIIKIAPDEHPISIKNEPSEGKEYIGAKELNLEEQSFVLNDMRKYKEQTLYDQQNIETKLEELEKSTEVQKDLLNSASNEAIEIMRKNVEFIDSYMKKMKFMDETLANYIDKINKGDKNLDLIYNKNMTMSNIDTLQKNLEYFKSYSDVLKKHNDRLKQIIIKKSQQIEKMDMNEESKKLELDELNKMKDYYDKLKDISISEIEEMKKKIEETKLKFESDEYIVQSYNEQMGDNQAYQKLYNDTRNELLKVNSGTFSNDAKKTIGSEGGKGKKGKSLFNYISNKGTVQSNMGTKYKKYSLIIGNINDVSTYRTNIRDPDMKISKDNITISLIKNNNIKSLPDVRSELAILIANSNNGKQIINEQTLNKIRIKLKK